MNERIQELIKHATTLEQGVDNGFDRVTFDKEKFAELIVRECISMADKESERYSNLDQEYCSMAMDNYRELVRKHFGVEE
jgi:hypothetical protein